MRRFFGDVCAAFPDSRFLHYNIGRAGRVLTGEDYAALLKEIPNLVATKNTSGDFARTSDIVSRAPELQHFLGERNFPLGCQVGECSLLASYAWLKPARMFDLFDAGRAGRTGDALRLALAVDRMAADVFGWLKRDPRVDGAYDKLVIALGGLAEMPLRLLSPYEGFTQDELERCREILTARHADWT